jgi:glycosyltransferase involved in cell wall biosynthesis
MKVALVSFYLMESTIPLAKYLSLAGVEVDMYSLLPQCDQNTYVFDFLAERQPNGFVESKIIKIAFGDGLYNYLKGVTTKVFIYPDSRFQQYFLIDLYYAFLLANCIKKRKYDLIHIIHFDKRFWFFLNFFLGKKKIIQTLHEVTSHDGNNSTTEMRRLNLLIKKSTPIIFHSNISKKRFIEFRKNNLLRKTEGNDIVMIRFGLFETYNCFTNEHAIINDAQKINILNFGRIVPSKGIHILVDAVKLLQERYPIHLIIAGSGVPYFDLKDIRSYEFINRHISNEEIAKLIRDCTMVVLPYTSASQSGIPMTVYTFDKPIVASNIAGLKEVIEHLNTGILVDEINAQSFAKSIELLLGNPQLRDEIKKNINEKYRNGEYAWSEIAIETKNFYQKHLINNN